MIICVHSDQTDGKLRFLTKDVIVAPPPLQVPLTYSPKYRMYTMPISIGTPAQKFDVGYDLLAFESFIGSMECKNCDNTTFVRKASTSNHFNGSLVTTEYGAIEGVASGNVDADIIMIAGNTTKENAGFVLTKNLTMNPPVQGILSFGYNYDKREKYVDPKTKFETNMNVLQALYTNYDLNLRSFSQRIFSNNSGYLYLGGVAPDVNTNAENYTTCGIPSGSANWKCTDISHVLIGNDMNLDKAYKLTQGHVYFSTLTNLIIAPYRTLDYFTKNYFPNSTCRPFKPSENYTQFVCDSTMDLTNMSDVHIVINSYAYRINAADMLSDSNTNVKGRISTFKFKDDNNNSDWIIGQALMKNYDMVFDPDNRQIGFSGGFRHYFPTGSSSTLMWILIALAILVAIAIAIFVFCYCCRKRAGDEYQPQN
jgi:hypothetical protein